MRLITLISANGKLSHVAKVLPPPKNTKLQIKKNRQNTDLTCARVWTSSLTREKKCEEGEEKRETPLKWEKEKKPLLFAHS